jgi:toxin YhaV
MAKEKSQDTALVVNGWRLFAHPVFLEQLMELNRRVEQLARRRPDEYAEHREARILAAILKIAFEVVPADPGHRMFNQGNTLGPANRHWRRAKFFNGRYRLFFQFSSAQKVIVLAWVNDEETLRTYDKRTDAYAVFKSMLNRGRPPTGWSALLDESRAYPKKPGAA